MDRDRKRLLLAIIVWLMLGIAFYMMAQDFKVASMRRLDFDISAFINDSVTDKNGEACALVKVTPVGNFTFAGPLGIVKQVNKPGEIWLFMPQKSRYITIKHPRWGVIRDYRFEKPLESRVAYELVLTCPKPIVEVRTDTVTVTHTVTDTLVVEHKRPRLPLRTHALLTLSGHRGGPSYGIMLALMRRHGAWVHARGNMRGSNHRWTTADAEGRLNGEEVHPYYTGHTRYSMYTVTAGAMHHLWRGLTLLEGLGYCHRATTWQLADSEDGGYVKRSDLSGGRMAAELGLAYAHKRLTVLGTTTWAKDWGWQGTLGMGINF